MKSAAGITTSRLENSPTSSAAIGERETRETAKPVPAGEVRAARAVLAGLVAVQEVRVGPETAPAVRRRCDQQPPHRRRPAASPLRKAAQILERRDLQGGIF